MSATVHRLRPKGRKPSEKPGEGNVAEAGYLGSDEALVADLLQGSAGAPAALYDRYSGYVERLLVRVLGSDPELPDLLHEVFAEVFTHIHKLKDPAKLKGWLTRVTVFTARGAIRRRRRRRWLRYYSPEVMPDVAASTQTDQQAMVSRVYVVLEAMGTQERLAFSLRRIEGMTLPECAEATGVSLATFKRRLKKADEAFQRLATKDPLLRERLERVRGTKGGKS